MQMTHSESLVAQSQPILETYGNIICYMAANTVANDAQILAKAEILAPSCKET